ncbi:MAG TPA: hypothetical protein VGJ70_15105, partial [Solirubrobacteraceae bacterium]
PESGLADRYTLLSVPSLLAAWFAWERFGPARARRWVQAALLAVIVVLLPFNIERAHQFRDWYATGMAAVQRDLDAGVPRDALVRRHQSFLLHWDGPQLARGMQALHDEGIGPFGRMRERPGPTPRRPQPVATR